ncbi:HNH endonuclease signature motif containing protein [Streptomyces apocyni]|uniref:HNH endonuclease signature motif containing protein n=1 Tax=Streptomyces apocyni TaxID=2654677 RepID=UPI001E539C71|nr:HNH endonuclease signature motif containing protein [Streptomyces apocyni]
MLPQLQRDLATEVDHIDGLGPLGPRGFDPANWQAMSKRHHSRKTARETFGTS